MLADGHGIWVEYLLLLYATPEGYISNLGKMATYSPRNKSSLLDDHVYLISCEARESNETGR